MKKLLTIFVLSLFFISCKKSTEEDNKQKSSTLELRQLVQETETKKETYGSYFVIGGSFRQSEEKETTVKVFAKVQGRYRLIEMPIDKIRIAINNKLTKPNIVVEYEARNKQTDDDLISHDWFDKVYIINCPEQYLPEKLLPIGL